MRRPRHCRQQRARLETCLGCIHRDNIFICVEHMREKMDLGWSSGPWQVSKLAPSDVGQQGYPR